MREQARLAVKAEELQAVRKQEMMELMHRALQDDAVFHTAVNRQLQTQAATAEHMRQE